MNYSDAKTVVDLLIDTLMLKESDRNIVMELLMNDITTDTSGHLTTNN